MRETFCEEDAEIILTIPVREQIDDYIALHFDTKGCFYVKSTYEVHVEAREQMSITVVGNTSNTAQNNIYDWKSLWKRSCPSKIHHFLWRLGHNSLANRTNINRRGMENKTLCPVCNRLDEDGVRLFLKCKYVKQSWRAVQMEDVPIEMEECGIAKEIINYIMRKEEKQAMRIAIFLW